MSGPKSNFWVTIGLLLVVGPSPSSGQPVFTRILDQPFSTDRANSPGVAFVDYDGDDDIDLYVANISAPNFLYENDGTGTFEKITTGPLATDPRSSRGLCWGDYDNNGLADVFLTSSGIPALYKNLGAGEFELADNASTFGVTDLRGWACTWGDYDEDGFIDLVITHPAGFAGAPALSNLLFRNRGDGTFEQITTTPISVGLAPYTVATFSDYDLDGDLDLFIGSGPATGTPGNDFLYRNQLSESGSATFERITDNPIATEQRDGQVINWIDYDNDRDLDAYVTNWGGANNGTRDELFRNDGGTMVAVTEGPIVSDKQVSLANVWGDFDNDGDLDVFVTDGNGGRANRMYLNQGDGSFSRTTVGPVVNDVSVSWGASAGDFDGDGDLDLYVSNAQSNVPNTANFMYRNDTDNANHWLRLKLVGVESNRSAIGAKVHALATIGGSATWQFREVSSQNSFNGHNSLFVHFGLGDATTVDSLIVQWPSGRTDIAERVGGDRFLEIVEGQTPEVVSSEGEEIPGYEVILHQNHPNPFVDNTIIEFRVSHASAVRLEIFDALGRLVAVPVDGNMGSGPNAVEVSMTGFPAGIYLYRLITDDVVKIHTMTLSK